MPLSSPNALACRCTGYPSNRRLTVQRIVSSPGVVVRALMQDAQAQTGYRYTYLYSAWGETLEVTGANVAVRVLACPQPSYHGTNG